MTVKTTTTASKTAQPAKTANRAATQRSPASKKSTPVKAQRVSSPKTAAVNVKRNVPSPTAKPAAPVKAVQSGAATKAKNKKEIAPSAAKDKKVKVVRDSFTIPKNEFSQLAEMKKKALALGLEIKKSELIRAGLMLLGSSADAAFKKALAAVPTLKTGRPGKG